MQGFEGNLDEPKSCQERLLFVKVPISGSMLVQETAGSRDWDFRYVLGCLVVG